MPNIAVASLIAQHLPSGLPHPGNPAVNQPAILIPLPGFRTDGMAPHLVDQIDAVGKLIGEAVVNLIETDGDSEIVAKAELKALRAPPQGHPMPVLCMTCRQPMLWLKVENGRAAVSPALLDGVNRECPHTISENGD